MWCDGLAKVCRLTTFNMKAPRRVLQKFFPVDRAQENFPSALTVALSKDYFWSSILERRNVSSTSIRTGFVNLWILKMKPTCLIAIERLFSSKEKIKNSTAAYNNSPPVRVVFAFVCSRKAPKSLSANWIRLDSRDLHDQTNEWLAVWCAPNMASWAPTRFLLLRHVATVSKLNRFSFGLFFFCMTVKCLRTHCRTWKQW